MFYTTVGNNCKQGFRARKGISIGLVNCNSYLHFLPLSVVASLFIIDRPTVSSVFWTVVSRDIYAGKVMLPSTHSSFYYKANTQWIHRYLVLFWQWYYRKYERSEGLNSASEKKSNFNYAKRLQRSVKKKKLKNYVCCRQSKTILSKTSILR